MTGKISSKDSATQRFITWYGWTSQYLTLLWWEFAFSLAVSMSVGLIVMKSTPRRESMLIGWLDALEATERGKSALKEQLPISKRQKGL